MGTLWSRCRRPGRWSCLVPLAARVSLASGEPTTGHTTKRISRCPDVIEAHENRYERGPMPAADVWTRIPRPPPPPPPTKPPSPKLHVLTKAARETREGRKLPTQHQHPLGSSGARLPSVAKEPAVTPNLKVGRTRLNTLDVLTAFSSPLKHSCFGYDIRDVDAFLAEASLERPANIPMVLCRACPLFRWSESSTKLDHNSSPPPQLMLPLGMVVNGVFRQHSWLYAQTPHGHEGFIRYAASLPLGILPSPHDGTNSGAAPPCWESASDVFPRPRGFSPAAKAITGPRSERAFGERKRPRRIRRSGVHEAEKGVDKLYLRALQQRCVPAVQSERIQHDFGFV